MIDVDDRCVRGDLLDTAPRALQVARVEEENELWVGAGRRHLFDLVEPRQKRIHLRQRRRDDHPCMLAGSSQRFREREAAAERVTVGVLVTEDQDLLIGLDELFDLIVLMARCALGGGYCFSSSAGRTSLSSSEI